MALIKCNECGKEISDKATTCIHCGCTIEKKYICPECGEKISSKSKVCQNCGYFNPLKKLTKLDKIFIPIIVISIIGGIIIAIINFIGGFFNFHIGLNLITSIFVGILGIPGAIVVILIKLLLG